MKKKSLVLLTFIVALAVFLPKFLDDRKAEIAFDKAVADSNIASEHKLKQSISVVQSSVIIVTKLIEEENFNDVESLDFYNVSIEEEDFSDTKSVDVEFPKVESTTISKQVASYNLPNRSNKILKSLTKKSLAKNVYELDMSDPVSVEKIVLEHTVATTKWAVIDVKVKDYSIYERPTLIASNQNGFDRISTTQASNEKPKVFNQAPKVQPLKEIAYKADQSKKDDEELVFFDYSKDDKEITANSNVVVTGGSPVKVAALKKTIHTFVASGSSINKDKELSKIQTAKNIKNDDSNKVIEANKLWNLYDKEQSSEANNKLAQNVKSNQPNKDFLKTKTNSESLNKSFNSSRAHKSNLLVKPYIVGTKAPVRNFDIRFSDDSKDIISDSGNGEVNISLLINNEMSIRRSTIIVKDMMPTTIDLVFEEGDDIAPVPMISNKKIESILSSQNFRGNESFLLVELDRATEDVDIDAKYSGKVFLNSKFKVVNRADSDFNYILFVDAMPGNTIINFLNTKNETISKIIHLEAEEVYFEPNFYREVNEDEFDLNEENLLSKTIAPLSVDSADIMGLTFDSDFKKLTLNKYQVGNVLYPVGTRSYIQLNHLRETVFVGRWNTNQVTIPSETYMRFVLGQFSLGSVGSQCLIQINLSKKANSYSLSGQAADRMMGIQTKILDTDGLFYSDFSAESKKIFILGEEQGIINAKIKYTDGSEDYLQSYCSNSTYLVEQL